MYPRAMRKQRRWSWQCLAPLSRVPCFGWEVSQMKAKRKGKGVSTKIYFGGQPLLSMKKSSPLHPPTQHGICILNDAETKAEYVRC